MTNVIITDWYISFTFYQQ